MHTLYSFLGLLLYNEFFQSTERLRHFNCPFKEIDQYKCVRELSSKQSFEGLVFLFHSLNKSFVCVQAEIIRSM